MNITPKWHLDFLGKFLTHNDIPESGYSDQRYAEIMKENTKYMALRCVHYVNQFIFMQLDGIDNSFRAIDITNNNTYHFNTLIDNIKIAPQGSTTDGLLVVIKIQEFIRHYSNPYNNTKYESIKELLNNINKYDKGFIVLKIKLREDVL